MDAARTVLVCALLALAGCTAPSTTAPGATAPATTGADATATTSSDPTTDSPDGVVVDGDLDVAANATHERVQRLLGAEYEPTRVVVRDLSGYKTADYDSVPFFRLFGVSDPALDRSEPTGLTTLDATVYLSPADAGPGRVEQVLAHEFAHVGQLREELVPWFGELSLERVALDQRLARRALVEGGAVFVTDAYTREHLPETSLQSERIAAGYANASSGNRVAWSQYHFGQRYVTAAIDSPENLGAVYDDPPETTENVLHPNASDAPVPLNVTVETETYPQANSPTTRAGELLMRIALHDAVGRESAIEASTGWGNDRVVAFATNGTRSLAWVTRWDSPADADEFGTAARALGGEPDVADGFRVERVDDATVVAFAGTESFVERASAAGNVTVAA